MGHAMDRSFREIQVYPSLESCFDYKAASMGDSLRAHDSKASTLELTHGGVPDAPIREFKSFPRA